MALYQQNSVRKRTLQELKMQEEEGIGSLCRLGNQPISPKTQLEHEKRIRREIANNNERRRMQSINAGFQSLRALLPLNEGEKLSKAAILQHTSEYIYQLEQEKTKLLSQNCQLKRLLNSQVTLENELSNTDSPLPKRKKVKHITTAESSDEGIGNMSPHQESKSNLEEVKSEVLELRVQLDRERRLRMILEEQTRNLESQVYQTQTSECLMGRFVSQFSSQQQLVSVRPEDDVSPEGIKSSNSRAPESPQDLSGRKSNSEEVLHATYGNSVVQVPRAEAKEPQNLCKGNSTSRQNLETIVEAIRHLEGDHLFRDDPEPPEQTRSASESTPSSQLHISRNKLVMQQLFHCPPVTSYSRPGVIVTNRS
ncbi:transcription factor AP-4-like isoform X1 [Tachypleus tridentatus]|uniref:transcription factor AP-4-like isoform X1 n=1 Tax=Tachypleus tridentatus TaxID=6853 RepID=UPI003FD4987E